MSIENNEGEIKEKVLALLKEKINAIEPRELTDLILEETGIHIAGVLEDPDVHTLILQVAEAKTRYTHKDFKDENKFFFPREEKQAYADFINKWVRYGWKPNDSDKLFFPLAEIESIPLLEDINKTIDGCKNIGSFLVTTNEHMYRPGIPAKITGVGFVPTLDQTRGEKVWSSIPAYIIEYNDGKIINMPISEGDHDLTKVFKVGDSGEVPNEEEGTIYMRAGFQIISEEDFKAGKIPPLEK